MSLIQQRLAALTKLGAKPFADLQELDLRWLGIRVCASRPEPASKDRRDLQQSRSSRI